MIINLKKKKKRKRKKEFNKPFYASNSPWLALMSIGAKIGCIQCKADTFKLNTKIHNRISKNNKK